VFSALGFYPVCPATDQYVLGAPLFPQATLHLPGGHDVVLHAPANSAENKYTNRLTVNGQEYSRNWLSHAALVQGAVLNFEMSAQPNTARGTGVGDAPFSVSKAAPPPAPAPQGRGAIRQQTLVVVRHSSPAGEGCHSSTDVSSRQAPLPRRGGVGGGAAAKPEAGTTK